MSGPEQRFLWQSESLGVALVDGRARILRASPTLQRIIRAGAVGRSVAELVVDAQRDALLGLLRDAGDDWATIRVAVPAGGSTRDFRAWVTRAGDAHLLVLEPLWQDVAAVSTELLLLNDELLEMERELRRHSDALEAQNERLLELDRLKEEFVSLISHELRTPLTSMRGYLELLAEERDGLDERQRRYVDVLSRNVGRLLRLVEDLLLVVQLDAGALALDVADVDLAALVEEGAQLVAPTAEEKGIALAARASGGTTVRGDRVRLAQLLDNLLTNAVKFTPGGGRVEVAAEAHGDGAALVVSDTGIGIPEAERARVFDRFYRVSGDERRATPGTGLGLAVARAIADAHEAEISVESPSEGGTVFRVALPAQPAAEGR